MGFYSRKNACPNLQISPTLGGFCIENSKYFLFCRHELVQMLLFEQVHYYCFRELSNNNKLKTTEKNKLLVIWQFFWPCAAVEVL